MMNCCCCESQQEAWIREAAEGKPNRFRKDNPRVNYKLSFHVQIDLSRLIIFYISIYYLKLSIQESPGKASCISLFSGYYSGYSYKLAS